MANRITTRQSEHDNAVRAAARIYRKKGRVVSINPDGEQNEDFNGYYIDVIARESNSDTSAWLTEIETEDSVNETEAKGQWTDYDEAYKAWHLAVPVSVKEKAETLLKKFGIKHCTIITWKLDSDGSHTFWGLPGA